MVRLKDATISNSRLTVHWFQFQNGAIKSELNGLKWVKPCRFQFQNGAIKSRGETCNIDFNHCFNSKMVRLKVTVCLFCLAPN